MGKFRKTINNNVGRSVSRKNNNNCLCYYGWETCCDSNVSNTQSQNLHGLLTEVESITMNGRKVSKTYINRMISLLSQRGIDINNRGTISQTFNQLSPSDINRVQNRILRLNSMSLNTVKNKLLSNAGNNTGGNDQLMWF